MPFAACLPYAVRFSQCQDSLCISPDAVLQLCSAFFCTCTCMSQVKQLFPRDGSKATPPHPSADFKWKDYCPLAFKQLREVFNIDPGDYMLSVCGECLPVHAALDLSAPAATAMTANSCNAATCACLAATMLTAGMDM